MESLVKLSNQENNLIELSLLMGDVLYSFFHQSQKMLKSKGVDLYHDQKHKFNDLISSIRNAETKILKYTDVLKGSSDQVVDTYINQADLIYLLIILMWDRIYENREAGNKVLEFLNSLPTQNGLDLDYLVSEIDI